jgi:very-short-patch-repair endonuclease
MASLRARSLRNNPTDAERRLWARLRYRQIDGHRFRRQMPIGSFIADFACLECRIVIEVDGGQHDLRRPLDDARTRWLASQGYRVLRFWNNDVLGNTDGVVALVRTALSAPHPDPPPQGGREGVAAT